MTLYEFILRGIDNLFVDAAEAVNHGDFEIPADDLPGVPMELFAANNAMQGAWKRYVDALPKAAAPGKAEEGV